MVIEKNALKMILVLQLLVFAKLLFLIFYSEFSSSSNLHEKVHERLLLEQQRVESDYKDFVEKLKTQILSTYNSEDVQKLRRGVIRKNFSHERKSDRTESTVRYSFYTVRTQKSEIEILPVFDNYKPKLLWDKFLQMMSRKALISTAEIDSSGAGGSNEKFSEMIGVVLKDSGLAALQEPGQFGRFDLLGEDIMIYWNIIFKKCSSSIRKSSGQTQCVKGIFVGEIDRRNSVRDFAKSWLNAGQLGRPIETYFGLIDQQSGHQFVESFFPHHMDSSADMGSAIRDFLDDSSPRFYRENQHLAIVRGTAVLPHCLLLSKYVGDPSAEISDQNVKTISINQFVLFASALLVFLSMVVLLVSCRRSLVAKGYR